MLIDADYRYFVLLHLYSSSCSLPTAHAELVSDPYLPFIKGTEPNGSKLPSENLNRFLLPLQLAHSHQHKIVFLRHEIYRRLNLHHFARAI